MILERSMQCDNCGIIFSYDCVKCPKCGYIDKERLNRYIDEKLIPALKPIIEDLKDMRLSLLEILEKRETSLNWLEIGREYSTSGFRYEIMCIGKLHEQQPREGVKNE